MAALSPRRLLLPLTILVAAAVGWGAGAAAETAAEAVPGAGNETAAGQGAGAGATAEAAPPAGSAEAAYLLLRQEIREAEQALAQKILGAGGTVEQADVDRLAGLAEKARLSLYGDLIDRSALLLIMAQERLSQERLAESRSGRVGEIMASRQLEEQAARARGRRSAALWSSLGASAASFAAAFTFWYLSEWQDQQYFLAPTLDEAARHRAYFELFSWMSWLSAGVGVLSAGVAIPLLPSRTR